MNRALAHLWFTLLKRRASHVCQSLWRPTTLTGFMAIVGFFAFIFYHRDHVIFGYLTERRSVIGLLLLMLGGSLFKGFGQRGLVFEPPDVEFLFTGPFTQREIIFYRLWPNYLFAVVEGLVFWALLMPHLRFPVLTAVCFTLFQIACFHISMAASIFASGLSEPVHYRARWMILGVYFIITVVYLRTEWDLQIIPSVASSPWFRVFFYPAATLSDINFGTPVHRWALQLMETGSWPATRVLLSALYLGLFVGGALLSLWLLLRLKDNVFETSLPATFEAAEKRIRIRQGRRVPVESETRVRSGRLPRMALYRGVGAVFWKNLVIARRSRRELALALAFTAVYTGFLTALLWLARSYQVNLGPQGPEIGESIAGLIVLLGFLLQRTFPFDFRADGHHLLNFRTLPVSGFALALAEIAVPTLCCLAFQGLGIAMLMIFVQFSWSTILFQLLAFPAVALALNSVWNLHYLFSAARSAGRQAQSSSAVGMLLVVALSFLVFFPAGWTGVQLGQHLRGPHSSSIATWTALGVQYAVNLLLLMGLGKQFARFEAADDLA